MRDPAQWGLPLWLDCNFLFTPLPSRERGISFYTCIINDMKPLDPLVHRTAPLVIGIAGGSGSGKTTVAQEILQRVGPDRIAFLQHDSYYKDLSGLPPIQKAEVNFDHPNSLETDLLIEHIAALRDGRAVEVPIYDFSTHSRTTKTFTVQPRRVILVEGILFTRSYNGILAI